MITKQIDNNTFKVMNGGVPVIYKCGDCKSIYLSNFIYEEIFGIPRCSSCKERLEEELKGAVSENEKYKIMAHYKIGNITFTEEDIPALEIILKRLKNAEEKNENV